MSYAKEAIAEPYAPAFVVMAQLTEDKVEKYAYLSMAILLFKSPDLKYWDQFNEYCLPNLSEEGVEDATKQINAIMINDIQKKQAKKIAATMSNRWKTKAPTN